MNRRDFLLKLAAMSAGVQLLPYLPAYGQSPNNERFFLHIMVEGGMDVACAFDPFTVPEGGTEADYFLGYNTTEIIKVEGLTLAPTVHVMKKHAKNFSIINGIQMSPGEATLQHESARAYMATGKLNGSAAMVGAALSASLTDYIAPFKVLTGGKAEVIGNTSAGSPLTPISGIESTASEGGIANTDIWAAFAQMIDPSLIMPSLSTYSTSGDVLESLSKMLGDMKTTFGNTLLPEQSTVAAFATGASRFSFINFAGDLSGDTNIDTHGGAGASNDGHELHLTRCASFWKRISEIFDILKSTPYKETGKSLFDQTTIFITNDFSKTAYKTGTGKDHNNTTNFALLAGKGVKGGQMIGTNALIPKTESSFGRTKHCANPFDFDAQKSLDIKTVNVESENTKFIKPENVIATVRDIFGVSADKFKSVEPTTPIIKDIKS